MNTKDEIMKLYEVEFQQDGFTKSENVEGVNPGHAFAKCIKSNPGAKMLRATISSRIANREFWIEYEAPPVPREPEKSHRAGKEQTKEFEFMAQVPIRP